MIIYQNKPVVVDGKDVSLYYDNISGLSHIVAGVNMMMRYSITPVTSFNINHVQMFLTLSIQFRILTELLGMRLGSS